MTPNEAELEQAFAAFTELWARGEAPAPEEYCAGHPAIADRLAARIRGFLATAVTRDPGGPRQPPLPTPADWGNDEHEDLGPYRILGVLGDGGMGRVYVAEQTEPIRRRVAIKLIKLGLDTKEVLARFRAERQALAMMNHPNIAMALDAGATPEGRPFFVMELVKGIPITEFCDQHRLSIRDRLGLFLRVCKGVQHAHEKGVLHRDLKPTNVLVELQDGEPVPKIIDFGIAKSLSQRLTDETLFTQHGRLIGTPEYMSPEQAEMSALDVDTRSDIYSLGVILYELLSGCLPFATQDLRGVGDMEMRRRIREEEPGRPSTRLAAQAPGTDQRAQRRATDARVLVRALRGDLDWITMMALEKDRGRRYGSAEAMADDIQRHLDHRPVAAGPPTLAYRARKLLRRRRRAVLTAGIAGVALLLGGAAAWWWDPGSTAAIRELLLECRAEEPGGWFGRAVAPAGRIDADDVEDILVGAHRQRVGDDPDAGRAYVVSGATGETLLTLKSGTESRGERFGRSVAARIGAERRGSRLLVGADGCSAVRPKAGAVFVFDTQGSPPERLDGEGANDRFGEAIDVCDRFLVASAVQSLACSGYVQVFSAESLEKLETVPAPAGASGFGASVALLRHGRGRPVQLVVGASGEEVVYVYSLLPAAAGAVTARRDRHIRGNVRGFGCSVAAAGDLDGDGFVDIVVGADEHQDDRGLVRVYKGRDGTLLGECAGEVPSSGFGWSVSSAGDLDGDGRPEVLAGSFGRSADRRALIAVLSWRDGALSFLWTRPRARTAEMFGISVAGGVDFDGDGVGDILVGAPVTNEMGRVYVFNGRAATVGRRE